MNQTKFAVSRFENRNGVISWRVDGRLHGVRFRRNFKTKEEAAAEKAASELQALQSASGIRSATTFLADAQLREAEDAFRRLERRSPSLLDYLDYALAIFRASCRGPAGSTKKDSGSVLAVGCFMCSELTPAWLLEIWAAFEVTFDPIFRE